jgi:RecB family exonuclease
VAVLRGASSPAGGRESELLAALSPAGAAPLRKVAAVIAAVAGALPRGLSAALWELWAASGLQDRWVSRSERGGHAGARADRDLDAVIVLFDAAARYADRLPRGGATAFLEHLTSQQFAGDSLAERAPQGDAVAVCSAHAAAGREWQVVAVSGLADGRWPDLRLRGSLLGVEHLVDRLSGIDAAEPVSQTAPLLAEERRLLRVAVSRARHTLLVGAVRNETEQPSGFLDELDPPPPGAPGAERPLYRPARSLQAAALVGALRRAACDGELAPAERARAARGLARLAAAGVRGAHPDSWYGLAPVSTDEPPLAPGTPLAVSPSTLEVLRNCPLRWLLSRHGGADPAELPVIAGSLVHALSQAVSAGASAAEAQRSLRAAWARVDAGAPWFSRREADRLAEMLASFDRWLESTRDELTFVAAEREIEVDVPVDAGHRPVRVRGRVDRLERDTAGRGVVVDLKTGKQVLTTEQAREHPQLAVYQLAVLSGAFAELLDGTAPGGARLLYLAQPRRASGAAQREQEAMGPETAQAWLAEIRAAAADSEGPSYRAAENPDCPRCPVRACCPLHEQGRQVSQ